MMMLFRSSSLALALLVTCVCAETGVFNSLLSTGFNHIRGAKCRSGELGRFSFNFGDEGEASLCGSLCAGWAASSGETCRAFVFEPNNTEAELVSRKRRNKPLCKFYGECSPRDATSRVHLYLAEEPQSPSGITFFTKDYTHNPQYQCAEKSIAIHYLSDKTNVTADICAHECEKSDLVSDGEPCGAFLFEPFYSQKNRVTGISEYLPRCKLYSECTLKPGSSASHAYISDAAQQLDELTAGEDRAYFRWYSTSYGSKCEESSEMRRVDCVQHCAALCYQVMGVGTKRCSAFVYNTMNRMCNVYRDKCTKTSGTSSNWLYQVCDGQSLGLVGQCLPSDWTESLQDIGDTGKWTMSYSKQTMIFELNRCPTRGLSKKPQEDAVLDQQRHSSLTL
jgi:hypothetical protein